MAPMRQIGVALDDKLRERLERSAAAGGRSIAEEIRMRASESLSLWEQYPSLTITLMYAVGGLANDIRAITGHEWWRHPKALDALVAAVEAALLVGRSDTLSEGEEDTWPPDEPRVIGRIIGQTRGISVGGDDIEMHANIRARLADLAEMRGRFDSEKAALQAELEKAREELEASRGKRGPKKR